MKNNIISLHVIPKSSKNEIIGWCADANGNPVLKIKINATPEDGKANKALIKFLAKEWAVTTNAMEVVSGEASRHKRLKINLKTLYLQITGKNTA